MSATWPYPATVRTGAVAVAVGELAKQEGPAAPQDEVGALVDDLVWWPEYIQYRPA